MTNNVDSKPYTTNNKDVDGAKTPVNITDDLGYGQGFCYHLGVLMFMPFLSALIKRGDNFILQWIISFLLGAKNIEQTKTLNYSSLNVILGQTIKSTKYQRKKLKQYSTVENISKLISFNFEMVGGNHCTDYYYDPHTKHYTGLRNILKGWCSKVKMPAKVINSDFIHTRDGYPVYIEIDDTFEDIRVRFFKQVTEFRRLGNIPSDKEITFFIDRAIFSDKVFEKIINEEYLHLVTWEKDYKQDQWDNDAPTKQGYIERIRNDASDKKLIKYDYQEKPWGKNNRIRQIIVRIEQPGNNGTLEVSVLSDDFQRNAALIIVAMFNRWIQENDFKYLINHFGIDQIVTYDYWEYQEIKDHLEDKQHISGEHKSITNDLDKLRGKIKTVLYKLHRLNKKEQKKKLNTKELERKKDLEESKKDLNSQIENKEQQRKAMDKRVSKIDEMIKMGKQKMQTNTKKLLDIIKIISRNIFYKTVETFRSDQNDYRDDLLIFREVTRANGVIRKKGNESIISLCPVMELTPKMKRNINKTITEINAKNIEMPNSLAVEITLELADKVDSFFAFAK